ncbi:hypothetical protein JCM9279_003325 [Rhodotorula babjevae]
MHPLERSTSTPTSRNSDILRPSLLPPPSLALDAHAAASASASASLPSPRHLVFRLTHAGTTRLVALPSPCPWPSHSPADADADAVAVDFLALAAAARALFALAPGESVRALQYEDEAGDEGGVVTLSSTGELRALVALVGGGGRGGAGRAVRLRLVVEREEAEREGAAEEGDGAPDGARAALDAVEVEPDEDEDGASVAAPSARGRGHGMGSLRGARSPRASSAGERGEVPPPPPALPRLSPVPSAAHVRPALHARASTSALQPSRRAAPPHPPPALAAATASPPTEPTTPTAPPPPRALRPRKSLAALADFLAPNRHVAPVSSSRAPRSPPSSSPSSSTAAAAAAAADADADAPPPSYRAVVRMNKEAQHARRLGRGLIGACE